MKKIIAMVILVMLVMTVAYAEETIMMYEGFNQNEHPVTFTEEYKAFLKGQEIRNGIDTTFANVAEWWNATELAATTFVIDCYDDCANAVTGVAKDIGNTATNIWNCARGFVDGLFG